MWVLESSNVVHTNVGLVSSFLDNIRVITIRITHFLDFWWYSCLYTVWVYISCKHLHAQDKIALVSIWFRILEPNKMYEDPLTLRYHQIWMFEWYSILMPMSKFFWYHSFPYTCILVTGQTLVPPHPQILIWTKTSYELLRNKAHQVCTWCTYLQNLKPS